MTAVKPIAKLGRKHAVDGLRIVALTLRAVEAAWRAHQIGCSRVRRHDQNDVAEIDRLAVVIGELAVVHHLQQDIEKIRVRLLDFVQQQDAMGMLVDTIGQQPALIKTDIARRGADQATYCASPRNS